MRNTGLRELVYPLYSATVERDGNVRCRFVVPNSKFGVVEIVLSAKDAIAFAGLLTGCVFGDRDPDDETSAS